MNIKVFYKNGDQDIFDTTDLTQQGSTTENNYKSVMTKYHITWDEFLKTDSASHLNIYIYYYRKYGEQNSRINNIEYLDEIMLYDNDVKIYNNLEPDEIDKKQKSLPYGALEPGTWFTLVPYERKKDILRIDIDNVTRIYRHHQWNDLIDIYKFTYLETQYLTVAERKLDLENRIMLLFEKLLDIYEDENGIIAMDGPDIANEMGVPYRLIKQIQRKINKLVNQKK